MTTVSNARTTVATALAGQTGLQVATKVKGSITPPAAVVYPEAGTAPDTFDGERSLIVNILVLAQIGDHEEAQNILDPLIDSLLDLLGSTSGCGQVTWDNYGLHEYGGTEYMGVIFHVEVY